MKVLMISTIVSTLIYHAARTIDVVGDCYFQALVKIGRCHEIAPPNENYHGADIHML